MKRLQLVIISALVVLLSACSASGPSVNFDKNPEVDISNAKTFAWLKQTHVLEAPADFNPIVKVRIDSAIERNMKAKGYSLVANSEEADITISYTVGSRDKVKVDSFPVTYRGGFGWGNPYYGSHASIGMGTETTVRNYTEGKLAIDIYDVKTKQPAWHGWATQKITKSNTEDLDLLINTVVDQTLANL